MLNRILFLYLVTINGLTAFNQCCPYINEVTVYPANPTTIDSIYVVTKVTTPNLGNYLGYVTSQNGNNITLEGCYYSGLLTQWQTYVDSINLGVMQAGTYNLNFIAYLSNSSTNCDYIDTNSVQSNFVVGPYLSIDDASSSEQIKCYPNPVSTELITIKSTEILDSILVLNASGELLMRFENLQSNTHQIDFSSLQSGIYIIRCSSDESIYSKRIFKQ